ncbi:nucleotidyltransferase family protein [Phenylobacterium sp. LjRoot219]|uniref:nucleotidyltransferase family protein n=1 Tax=Phenylobacterium sp. LjRoot219 TaxID=3342283 RepID=UPI003ECC9E10
MTTEAREAGVLEAVVLAAGAARRFGGGKLLAPWRGGVLLDGALAAAFAAPVRSVTVVTGADAEAVAAAAQTFAEGIGEGARLRVVHAADHAEGMAGSLRAGIASLPADAAGVFIFLGDMPRAPTAVLAPLADQLAAGALCAAPMFQGSRGHPTVFAAALFPDLLALTGDQGARKVLERVGPALVEAPDDGVLFDVDERGDLG